MVYTPRRTRVIIIGTGWYGLSVAKTYKQINPLVDLTLLDSDDHIGGVWSRSRVYPELIADSPVGTFDFSDLSMEEALGLKCWDDIPGIKVTEYLECYSKKFGLLDIANIRLGCRVSEVREGKEGARWEIVAKQKGHSEEEILPADKVVVATGISSEPSFPQGLDRSKFNGLALHSKDVASKYQELASENVRTVVVYGGNKSAAEVVNMCALKGKKVHWVVRKDGAGPGVLINARVNGSHAGEVALARWSAVPSPSMMSIDGFWYWFLHSGKSRLGLWFTSWYWKTISKVAMNPWYKKSENCKKIAPDVLNFFWSTSGAGTLQDNSTLMQMIDEGTKIEVHRESITSMTGTEITLSDSIIPNADAIVFATGWQTSYANIFSTPLGEELGLPVPLSQQSPEVEKHWTELDRTADAKVCQLFPIFRNPPKTNENPPNVTPFRMYRESVPINLAAAHDRSIVFLGALVNAQVAMHAEVSALWAVAYMEDMLPDGAGGMLGDKQKMEVWTSEVNAWMRRRFRRAGIVEPTADLEIQGFMNQMMRDMGLRADRRRGNGTPEGFLGLRGFWREWFQPYRPGDYKGIVEEFLAIVQKRGVDDSER
ncbi:hypothetical protein BP5796_01589 [Coleophoma crateriformis]|uniref:L-ornithine N(5)-monooxygenase n=1 Tax=Coleophoma crateriformis TaxID=565419 RepID=A0A3D8T0V0_9HELO|nr:hypothetical protein BP5796_01589 [Coleophoma crateriformis]